MSTLTSVPRRLLRLRPLALELARASAPRPGVPSGDALLPLQRASDGAGGLPTLVAQTLSAYSLQPTRERQGGARVANGRRERAVAGQVGAWHSTPEPDPWRRFDLMIGSPLLRIGLSGGREASAYGATVLQAFGAEADANADADHFAGAARRAAERLAAVGSPVALDLRDLDEGTTEVLAAPVEGAGVAEVVVGHVRAGLVHGGLGAHVGRASAIHEVGHWTTVRPVSAPCRRFLAAVLDGAMGTAGPVEVIVAAIDAGIPRRSIETNVDRLLADLAPLRACEPVRLEADELDEPGDDGDVLADPLGVLHGLADLLAARAWCRA
ncbi:MAG: hypothetical protein U0P45_02040 [Acidimicrobiales bacterium]